MITSTSRFKSALAGALAAAFAATELVAAPLAAPVAPLAGPDLVQPVQADCYSIGQQIAAQNGGELARASASNQGGRTVCVIVVLIPGKDGQRPRRQQFVVPAG